MSKITNLCIFGLGAAVGTAVTLLIVKDKYKKQAQEEIDSVKNEFQTKFGSVNVALFPKDEEVEKECSDHVQDLIKNYRPSAKTPVVTSSKDIYVIAPEEFGEFEDYATITLTYYADQVLVDENNDIIRNVDEVVGEESLTHFGDYEDDAVHVRNDRLRCDYEILMDSMTYSESIDYKMPHKEG